MSSTLRRWRNQLKIRGIYGRNPFFFGLLPLADIAKDIVDTIQPYKQTDIPHFLKDLLQPIIGIYHLSIIVPMFIATLLSVTAYLFLSLAHLVILDFSQFSSSILTCCKEASAGVLCCISLALRGLMQIAMTPLAWLRIPFRLMKEQKKFEDRHSIQRLISDGENILNVYTKKPRVALDPAAERIPMVLKVRSAPSKSPFSVSLVALVMGYFYLSPKYHTVSVTPTYYSHPSTENSAPYDLVKIIKALNAKRFDAPPETILNKAPLILPIKQTKKTHKINTLATLANQNTHQKKYRELSCNECADLAIKLLQDRMITPAVNSCISTYFAWFKRPAEKTIAKKDTRENASRCKN